MKERSPTVTAPKKIAYSRIREGRGGARADWSAKLILLTIVRVDSSLSLLLAFRCRGSDISCVGVESSQLLLHADHVGL